MNWCWPHDWTKWEPIELYFVVRDQSGKIMPGSEQRKEGQRRVCENCGLIQKREVKTN